MLFDTHAHLDDEQYNEDREEVLARATQGGVGLIVNVGFDLASSKRSVELAQRHDFIYAAIGIHPHDAEGADQATYLELKELAKQPKVVAIGEIGLDYYRNLSPKDIQQKVFKEQLELAIELKKPVIIHDRDAHGDTMEILRHYANELTGGVLHCFSGSWEMAKECIKLGFYISLAGPVTFKNAGKLTEIATQVPLERLLIETDSPYLTPEPHRGKRNESANVAYVCQRVADLRSMSNDELAAQTAANGQRLFRI